MPTQLLTRKELRGAMSLLPDPDTCHDDECAVTIARDRIWYPRRPKSERTEKLEVRFLRVPFVGVPAWLWVLDPDFDLL